MDLEEELNDPVREKFDRKVLAAIGQEDLYESLGGGFDSEEIDEFIYNNNVNLEISRKLREQGVTKYLCENEDFELAERQKLIRESSKLTERISQAYSAFSGENYRENILFFRKNNCTNNCIFPGNMLYCNQSYTRRRL